MKAVIFDFYGTLAETPDWGPSWQKMVADVGYELPDDVRDRWWNDGLDGTEHDEHSRSRDHYIAWQQSRSRAMLAECGMPKDAQDAFIARVREIGGHRQIYAYAEVYEVLVTLRDRGYALAICSNWDWDLHEAIESAGLTGLVDLVVSSAWVGARKPHERIYRHMLDALDAEPEDVLFVGDTWTCDVAGPRAAGMRAVYVRRPHFAADLTCPEDHHRERDVSRAHDLTAVLTAL